MELCGENIFPPNRRSERFTVLGAGCHNRRIVRLRIKAMHKINIASARNTAIKRARRLCNLDLVPADLRNLEPRTFRKPNHFSRVTSQSRGAAVKLLAALKQRLVPHADPQKRPAGVDETRHSFEQVLFSHSEIQSSNAPK